MASVFTLKNITKINQSSKFFLGCKYNFRASSTNSNRDNESKTIDLTFTDTKEAFKSKKNFDLLRAYFVLKISSYDFLVTNHQKLIKIGRKVLGDKLFFLIIRKTFFAQFAAGENENDIKPKIDHLKSFGVKAILDYSAEEDVNENEQAKVNTNNQPHVELPQTGVDKQKLKQFQHQKDDELNKQAVARTYFYLNEAQCEKNMEIFLKCIDAVAGTTAHTGLAAVKLTALGRSQLLLQLSEVIARTKMFFTEVTGANQMALSQISPSQFQKQLDQRFNIKTDDEEVQKWFDQMDYDKRGLMNLFSWNGLIDTNNMISDVFKVLNLRTGKIEKVISCLTREEEEMFKNMMRRIHTIARHAQERDVRVMIDAEQTYFQPAINRITLELMRKYNKEKAIVFNTYQCYLKNAYENLLIDLELARRQNFYFGAKLVRGAYIVQERERAKKVGYEDPTNPTFEATTEMYNKCLTECLDQIVKNGLESKKISIMVASHNEETVKFTVKKMDELGIKPHHKLICFGQLLGMSDQISFILGQSGYSVYKYVPYGPIDEVIPYLCRRAVENHGVLEKVSKEKELMLKELRRRLLTGHLFYKPIGSYNPI